MPILNFCEFLITKIAAFQNVPTVVSGCCVSMVSVQILSLFDLCKGADL